MAEIKHTTVHTFCPICIVVKCVFTPFTVSVKHAAQNCNYKYLDRIGANSSVTQLYSIEKRSRSNKKRHRPTKTKNKTIPVL